MRFNFAAVAEPWEPVGTDRYDEIYYFEMVAVINGKGQLLRYRGKYNITIPEPVDFRGNIHGRINCTNSRTECNRSFVLIEVV